MQILNKNNRKRPRRRRIVTIRTIQITKKANNTIIAKHNSKIALNKVITYLINITQ